MPPLISIIMPIFNSQSTLERALQSIERQNYPRLDVILVDGSSSDNSIAIAEQHSSLFSHIISEPDKGQTDALNKGFRLATGEVFCWLNGDDAYADGALWHVARIFIENPECNIVIGTSRRIYADRSEEVIPVGDEVLDNIGFRNGIDQPSCFWRAKLHRNAGELDSEYHFSMDWDWWNRLRMAGGKPVVTAKELSIYYFSEDNKTASQPNGNIREMYKVIKKYGPFNGELADVYLMLYEKYDLKGCYDTPPSAPREVMEDWWKSLGDLYGRYGREPIDAYNWNWCSKQVRGQRMSAPSLAEQLARPFIRRLSRYPLTGWLVHKLWARPFSEKKSLNP